jgi:FkbM family methyltransferase
MIKEFLNYYRLQKLCDLKRFNMSFSQFGEDMIVRKLFEEFHIDKPNYMDIGANHPFELNNTFHFYINDSKGLLLEPDTSLIANLEKIRKNDQIVNGGITTDISIKESEIYLLSNSVLNTFSKFEAEEYVKKGFKIIGTKIVKLYNFNELANTFFANKIDFVSLDIEGGELDVLKTIDFSVCRPKIFCIETWSWAKNLKEIGISDFLLENNYQVKADTSLNTIYVDNIAWNNRNSNN